MTMETLAPIRPRKRPTQSATRAVAVVTGTRAEYGILQTTLRAIDDHPKLRLQLVATGMHLVPKFGATVRQIERDGWTIDARISMQQGNDQPSDQSTGLGRGIDEMGRFFSREQTDLAVVLGDRIEAMAGALAAITTGRFVAHIHGGDVAPGDIDNSLRNSITKLAHIHFPATETAAERIIRFGESSRTVHVVGAPGLDDLYRIGRIMGGIRRQNRAIVIQHAYGRPVETERKTMLAVLSSLGPSDVEIIIVYPNSDRGHDGIIAAINEFSALPNRTAPVRVVRSLPRDKFLRLLHTSRLLIGNSSCGIIESAAAGIPCVNVGSRQLGRCSEGDWVIHADESPQHLRRAVKRALSQRIEPPRSDLFGQGNAGRRIAGIIAETELTDALRRKTD
jgi:UDP-hydrolysing UDP-N-acetyl-D-glucosamine 2-epimerase